MHESRWQNAQKDIGMGMHLCMILRLRPLWFIVASSSCIPFHRQLPPTR